MSMEQSDIDAIGRSVNATARHQRLVEETSLLQRREKARDRLLLAIAEALHLSLHHTYNLVGHSEEFSPLLQQLRDAKIIFAGTLDKS
jgi:hypothetical protein